MDDPSPPAEDNAIFCPQCGQPVSLTDPDQRLIECRNCNNQFFVDSEEDEPEPETEADEETDELDGLRIRHLVHFRRAAIRSRTYAIVAMAVCMVAAVRLLLMATERYHGGKILPAAGCAVAAFFAVVGMTFFGRKSAALHREAIMPPPPPPINDPHFESLSDGTQHVKNLEEM